MIPERFKVAAVPRQDIAVIGDRSSEGVVGGEGSIVYFYQSSERVVREKFNLIFVEGVERRGVFQELFAAVSGVRKISAQWVIQVCIDGDIA